MNPKVNKGFALAACSAVLVGCATPSLPPTLAYRCEDGGGFRLRQGADRALLEYSGMFFELAAEPSAAGVERFSCGMLRLTRQDGLSEVAVEGRVALRRCRPAT